MGFKYNDNVYYYHKNISGDIIGILDSNYNEIVTYEYDSFGNIVSMIDNSNINLGTINPFRYRSYYYDEETQLYYLNSRYYNPKTGRFINGDGIIAANDDATSHNLFNYVSNNPINYSDCSGCSFISFSINMWNTVRNYKTYNDLKLKTNKKNISTQAQVKASKKPSVSRPKEGDPNGIYDIPNGDFRVLGPFGNLKNAKDFDVSHPWRHPNLNNPHIHDFDDNGKRQDPRNPTQDEQDFFNDHKKEIGEAAIAGVTAYGIYLIVKWGAALATAPITGGGSLAIAGVTP